MRMKVEEKDFYEAYHILTRADNVEVNTEVLNEWRLFLEASLFLMKKVQVRHQCLPLTSHSPPLP